MKKIVIALLIGLPAFPQPSFSAYWVQLVSGGNFIVQEYWEKNNHILFYTEDGSVSIPKNVVRLVRPFNPVGVDFPAVFIASPKPPSSVLKTERSTMGSRRSKQSHPPIIRVIKDMERCKLQLETNLDEALEHFRHVSKNKDTERKRKAFQVMVKTTNELLEIKDKIEKSNLQTLQD